VPHRRSFCRDEAAGVASVKLPDANLYFMLPWKTCSQGSKVICKECKAVVMLVVDQQISVDT
jgi:hypothetical protein